VDRAADILYAPVSVEVYCLYVIERQWTTNDWKAWVLEDAARCLFPNASSTERIQVEMLGEVSDS